MRHDRRHDGRHGRRRLGIVPALGVLTACGVTFGLAGCGAAAEGAARFGSGDSTLISDSTVETAAPAADCPKVADRLPDVRVSDTVKRSVARGLGLLEIQVADADRRLAATAGKADPGTAQRAVLSSLADQRAATIERIADAIGSVASRPEGLGALATCTLSGAETAPAPTPSALPPDPSTGLSTDPPTDLPTDLPTDFPTDLPTDFSIDDLPSDFPSDLATALAGGIDGAPPAKAKKSGDKPATSPSPSAAPKASASPSPSAADAVTVDCPPVAAELRIPSAVKSDIAVQLGLLELRSANANRRLADQNTDQNTVLGDLERDRATIVRRIETILTRSDDATGDTGADLAGLVACQVNGGVLIDNDGSTDTAPTDDPAGDGQDVGQDGGSAGDDTWFASTDPGAGAGYGAN